MDNDSGKEMNEFMEGIADDLANTNRQDEYQHQKTPSEFDTKSKTVLLGGAGVVLLIILIALWVGVGDSNSKQDLSSLITKIDQLEAQFIRLEGMEKRVNTLEKKGDEIGSMAALSGRLDSLGKQVANLQKRITATNFKTTGNASKTSQTETPGKVRYYNVRSGDSLYRIGRKYGIAVDELRKLNKLKPSENIYPGQKLILPPG